MTRRCVQCGEAFQARRSTRLFCGSTCRKAANRNSQRRDQGGGGAVLSPTYEEVQDALRLVKVRDIENLTPEGLKRFTPSDIESAASSARLAFSQIKDKNVVQALLARVDQAQEVLLAFLAS